MVDDQWAKRPITTWCRRQAPGRRWFAGVPAQPAPALAPSQQYTIPLPHMAHPAYFAAN